MSISKFESDQLWLSIRCEPNASRTFSEELLAFANAIADAQREKICAAIKAEDDHCADGDYMMDSNDCIEVVRGTWKRPEWARDAIRANKE